MQCPLLAQSGHLTLHCTCPLSGVKRTWPVAEVCFGGRYWGQSGYRVLRRKCQLLTQSGHVPVSCPPPLEHYRGLVRCPVLSPGGGMRRRGKAGGKTIKTQRRKTSRRNAAEAAQRRSSPATAKETNVAQVISERDDALEQLTATAEVLTVMSRSAFELQTVFDALVKSATRLCHASASVIWRPKDDGRYHLA